MQFFLTFENMKQHTIKQKNKQLGLDPPTHFRVFLGLCNLFQLDKPLSGVQVNMFYVMCALSHYD